MPSARPVPVVRAPLAVRAGRLQLARGIHLCHAPFFGDARQRAPRLLGMRRAPRDRDLDPRIHLLEIERARACRVGIAIPGQRLPGRSSIHRLQHLRASSPVVHARAFQVRYHNCRAARVANLACLVYRIQNGCRLGAKMRGVEAARGSQHLCQRNYFFGRRCAGGGISQPGAQAQRAGVERLAQGPRPWRRFRIPWRRGRGGPCGCCAGRCGRQTQRR